MVLHYLQQISGCPDGYIDVGDKWMLVTLSWWQFLDVSISISILMTSFGCWCRSLTLKDRGCWRQKRPKPSLTSQSCRKHISSLTSVTNIDVALYILDKPQWPVSNFAIFKKIGIKTRSSLRIRIWIAHGLSFAWSRVRPSRNNILLKSIFR